MDPVPREHFDVAERNLTIAIDLLHRQPEGLDQPTYEWSVVVSFYAAVRAINAYILQQTGALPRSHSERYRYIIGSSALHAIVDDYRDLRDWSEQARYTFAYSAFDSLRAHMALDRASAIRDQVRQSIPEP